MSSSFKDKVVVVTGGSRGIGRQLVAAFCKRGAIVNFTYNRNEEAAAGVEQDFGAVKYHCPQGNYEAITDTVDHIIEKNGKIDILINNAGVTDDQFTMMMPIESWNKVLDTNLNGTFRWSKIVTRSMISAQGGAVVNIASVSGFVGIPGQTNYAASKGAILSFTRSLAAELGPKGVRVNAVVPGFIQTDMTAKMPRDIKRKNMDRILLKRFGSAEEVAEAVLFLASDAASYIIGQALVVDGGLTATVA